MTVIVRISAKYSLMFFMYVFYLFFYKSEKTFYVFYLQINVCNIYELT